MEKRVVTRAVVPQFNEIMSAARYRKVETDAFIPFTRIRPTSLSGVARLMSLFDGMMFASGEIETEKADTASCGISIGTDTPIIVQLFGTQGKYVSGYFQLYGL